MRKCFRSLSVKIICCLLMLLVLPSGAGASGYALIEQSVSGLGSSYAGGAAEPEDISTIFYNPAGLTRFRGLNILNGIQVIVPSARFKNDGSRHALGTALAGGGGGQGALIGLVPNIYSSVSIGEQLFLGLGINSPFGMGTDYEKGWVGRYHALKSDLKTININPTAAVRVTDWFSMGAGLNIQYMQAELSNAIDYGLLDATGRFSTFGLGAGALGLTPQGSDGTTTMKGDAWGVGYNFGIMLKAPWGSSLGAAYRSRINYKMKGTASFYDVPSGLSPYPIFKNCNAESNIVMPDTFSIGISHPLTRQLTVMADVTWTNWSVYKELRVKFSNAYQADSVVTSRWRDSYRYSLGLKYMPDEQWTLRAGTAYDQTPIRSPEYRTPRIPDGNRIWVSAGVGYKVSSRVSFDIGYAHIFVDTPVIEKSASGEDAARGGMRGRYSSHIDIAALQLKIQF